MLGPASTLQKSITDQNITSLNFLNILNPFVFHVGFFYEVLHTSKSFLYQLKLRAKQKECTTTISFCFVNQLSLKALLDNTVLSKGLTFIQ